MLDSLSVPRRAYDFEDYIDILRRNLRWILAPAFAGLVISTVVAYSMQDYFVSQALIRVTPQQISPDLIHSVTSQDVADRINSMAQTILSRNTLTSIINQYGLYKKDLKGEPMEDVINEMKKHIGILPLGGTSTTTGKFLPAMAVQFGYSDRYTAQRVCSDIVSRLMNLSTQDVVQSQEEAGQFLNDEVSQAKRDLNEAEEKLSTFQQAHAGSLPDESQLNMQEMNTLDGQLSALSDRLNRNTESRMMLESEMRIARERLAAIHSPQANAINQKVEQLDTQIENQQNVVSNMRERYKEGYPDLQAAEDQLEFLKRQRDAAAKEKPKLDTTLDDSSIGHERMEAQDTIDRIQVQLKANAMEGSEVKADIASTNNALKLHQARLERVPAGEKEYADLQRDRDLARARYLELSQKREQSTTSIDLERRKQGENLELLDNASLPTTPTEPNRKRIIPIGAVGGLILGLVLVGIREVKDTSLKNLKDARLYTQLSILGSIPLLENDIVVQRRKQVMWVGWATATIAGLAIMAGSVVHYYYTLGKG